VEKLNGFLVPPGNTLRNKQQTMSVDNEYLCPCGSGLQVIPGFYMVCDKCSERAFEQVHCVFCETRLPRIESLTCEICKCIMCPEHGYQEQESPRFWCYSCKDQSLKESVTYDCRGNLHCSLDLHDSIQFSMDNECRIGIEQHIRRLMKERDEWKARYEQQSEL